MLSLRQVVITVMLSLSPLSCCHCDRLQTPTDPISR